MINKNIFNKIFNEDFKVSIHSFNIEELSYSSKIKKLKTKYEFIVAIDTKYTLKFFSLKLFYSDGELDIKDNTIFDKEDCILWCKGAKIYIPYYIYNCLYKQFVKIFLNEKSNNREELQRTLNMIKIKEQSIYESL